MAAIFNTEASNVAFIRAMETERYVKIATNLIQTQRMMAQIVLRENKK